MELITLIALLSVSFLLAHQLHLQKSLQQVDHSRVTLPSMPRKLIDLHEETVKGGSVDKLDLISAYKKLTEASKDTKQDETAENVMNATGKGTWRETDDDDDEEEEGGSKKSEYFTMDYGWVRRRRPIHNKQTPFVP